MQNSLHRSVLENFPDHSLLFDIRFDRRITNIGIEYRISNTGNIEYWYSIFDIRSKRISNSIEY